MNPERERHQEIEPDIRPEFGLIQGGGESTSGRGNLSDVSSTPNETSKNLESREGRLGVIQGGGETTPERGFSSVDDQEKNPGKEGFFVDEGKPQEKAIIKAKGLRKKYGGVIALISVLGLGGGLIATLFAPAGMIIHLMENMTFTNDSSSTAMERRFLKVLGVMTKPTDPVCANSTKIKCKMGRISHSGLKKLSSKGIVGVFPDNTVAGKKIIGYPKENPKLYRITMPDGKVKNIKAADLTGFLVANPKIASKVLGRSGAFNLRVKAWSGKHVSKNFYDRFKLERDGGLADGKNKPMSAADRAVAAREKIQASIPSLEDAAGGGLDNSDEGMKDRIRTKAEAQVGKAKKGGAAYTTAVASCIAVKAPEYVAAGVAGAQVLQVVAPVMDGVLSPASKAKADGIEGTSFTSEDMDTVATPLTEQIPRESDKRLTSALDSQPLKASIGVEKGRINLSKDFTPGLGIISNPLVKAGRKASDKSQKACNGIMSEAAMYSAMAVDSAITVAASATVIGGVIKVFVGFVAGEVAQKVAGKAIESLATKTISEIAENDKIPTARGEALGDVMGIGAMAFFSAGGMSRHLPTLKVNQLASYDAVHRENEEFTRAMDIASLSPFDTTSRYTFFGSIANGLRNTAIAGGGYGLGSVLSSVIRSPGMILTSSAGAATGFNSEYCGYAKDFNQETEDPKNTPGITASGLPCVGITEQQAKMASEDATSLMTNSGGKGENWVDEDAEIPDDATIADLVESNVIREDTPLSDFISGCSDASTGDYIFKSAGCTTNSNTKDSSGIALELGDNACEGEGEDRVCMDPNEEVEGVKNQNSLVAQAPFLLDYQALQIINGEDEEEETTSSVASGDPMSITVSSYNMCQERNHPDCPNQATKIEKISSVFEGSAGLSSTPMDIVGAQELSLDTQRALMKSLSGYDTFPKEVPTSNGKAIFWNTAEFTLESGDFITGVNGNGDSESLDNNSFPWVKLTSNSGQNVFVMSIHSPNNGFGTPADRFENVQKIREWSESKSSDGSMVIITGDFNNGAKVDGGNPGAYCYLTEGGGLQHARDMAGNKPADQSCPGDPVPIDQVYVSTNVGGITASGWGHVRGAESVKLATDHSPAYVTISTPGNDDDGTGSQIGGVVSGDDYGAACAAGNSLGAPCNGQCVSFVKYRLLAAGTKYKGGSLGNGRYVVGTLAGLGYETGSAARVGSVFSTSQTSQPKYGHTGIVSQVNPDGSIVIEEYNFDNPKSYGKRTMSKAEYEAKGYSFAYVGLGTEAV